MNKEVNYIRLKRFSLFHKDFLYLDHKSNMADSLFIQNDVEVSFMQEVVKKDSDWKFVRCRIHKRDVDKFEDALSKLHNKCLICGVRGYSQALAQMKVMFPSVM